MNLTAKQELLLGIVREACMIEDGAVLCYFVPKRKPVQEVYGERVDYRVYGSGDAATLKSLERRRLIRKTGPSAYSYVVTEAGMVEYERVDDRKRKERGG